VICTLYTYDCLYGPILEGYDKGQHDFKVMVRTALKREPDQELFRPEAILFPERFCVDANADPAKQNLEQIWRDDPELFASQYMNDPLSLASDQFSIPRLKAHVIDRADIPATVNLYMTWDLAYSTTEHSDYSVGVLGGFFPQWLAICSRYRTWTLSARRNYRADHQSLSPLAYLSRGH